LVWLYVAAEENNKDKLRIRVLPLVVLSQFSPVQILRNDWCHFLQWLQSMQLARPFYQDVEDDKNGRDIPVAVTLARPFHQDVEDDKNGRDIPVTVTLVLCCPAIGTEQL